MKQEERHSKIIKIISESGFATIEELATLFDVTPQTIRRDLKLLDKKGELVRVHGGAIGKQYKDEGTSFFAEVEGKIFGLNSFDFQLFHFGAR